ncbi:GNAT family N-acetyltransferase [Streptomyces misionensis]|uniref:GNAT family N-acetyltransferase n=1 Tax=Streptomyces misionensis TaxID=67331 RepID=A0A5C6JZZ7_9ACTN|nr:GNAT family N-acetyltransferase [Streptomyces misionensis]TWV53633.1 GNAT family N-acetyltransferase [Streptomyces misionensis]
MTSRPHHATTTDPDGFRLRLAQPADAAAITAVFLASRAAALPYLPRLYSDEQTHAFIEAVVLPSCAVWVAELGDPARIVGFAALDKTVLDHLYLHPDVRRRGIGTALLETVKEASPGELSLHCFQRNAAARAFYERHGFTAGEFDDGSRNEENEPDVTYHWTAH